MSYVLVAFVSGAIGAFIGFVATLARIMAVQRRKNGRRRAR